MHTGNSDGWHIVHYKVSSCLRLKMLPLIVGTIILTVFWTFLRRKLLRRNTLLPENFVPDFGDTDEQFHKAQEERLDKLIKKRQDQANKIGEKSIFDLFDRQKESSNANGQAENAQENPPRKRTKSERASAFHAIRILKEAKGIRSLTSEMKKEIFQRVNLDMNSMNEKQQEMNDSTCASQNLQANNSDKCDLSGLVSNH